MTYQGKTELAFVLDQLYGSVSSDILLAHINTVLKKIKALKLQYPQTEIAVYLPNSTMASVGIDTQTLQSRLVTELNLPVEKLQSLNQVAVEVPNSVLADHYIEFGGDPRQSGSRETQGLLIKI